MRSKWTLPLLLAGVAFGFGCSSDPKPTTDAGVTGDMTPTDNPVVDMPVVDMPVVDMPVVDMQLPPDVPPDVPVVDMPPIDMPPVDMPVVDMPVVDMPVVDMPVVDMPVVDVPPPPPARVTQTNGSAVAITRDDMFAVAANRTANSISVFSVSLATSAATRSTQIPVADSEPWAAVIGNDDNTAYVVLRKTHEVVKVNNLRTTPTLATTRATVGSEPTGIAISPTGAKLYVANWAEGTVTEVNTADMTVARTIDLNASLAATGFLGAVTGRPGLAHPRALVVTNNGDTSDADETVYVTEFFSQAITTGTLPTDDSAFDLNRQGVVYRFNAGTGVVGPRITLAPVANTGFVDSDGAMTGCFPNQLSAIALDGQSRLYVTSVCTSPRGPVNVVVPAAGAPDVRNIKTQVHASVFVIDVATNTEIPAQGLLLTQRFQAFYDGPTPASPRVPDDGTRRMPLIPNDIAFLGSAHVAYVTSYGSDAVFRVHYNADGTFNEVGSATANFINLGGAAAGAGKLPVGIAIANAGSHALVVNANTRNVSVVQFSTQAVASVAPSADLPAAASAEANIAEGQRLFVTGLARWSLKGQGWNSCESCHADGLTDNVTWFFGRGPRQTISLDGSFDATGRQKMLNWTSIFDEINDFELNVRGNSGGVGAIVHRPNDGATPPVVSTADRIIFDGTAAVAPQVATTTRQDGLNGSTRSLRDAASVPRNALEDFNNMDLYVRSIRSPRAPTNLAAADVTAGRALFEANNCAGCHGGSSWTVSRRFYVPNEANNDITTGALITRMWTRPTGFPAALVPATSTFRPSPFNAATDQITCVLRNVGTFPATLDAMQNGVTPAGVRVREVRANGNTASPASMSVAAQGANGFNPPALVGMVTGAPYFHAGNARTLEEAFATTFQTHYQSLSTNFLIDSATRDTQIRQITAFLLSIDDATSPVTVPTLAGGVNPDLCPATFP